jgi:hypothetical protein
VVPSFPDNVMLFKGFNAVCLAMAAVGIARYMRLRLGGPRLAVAVGLVTAVSVPLLFLGAMLLSELTFLALLLFVLPSLERLADEPAPLWRAAALGVAVGACALVRTHGMVLAPAAALVLVSRGRWREAATLAAAALVTVLPWQQWSGHHAGALAAPLQGSYGSYGGWWRQGYEEYGPAIFARTLERTLPQTWAVFSVLFSPLRHPAARVATGALLVAATAMAVRAHWRRVPVSLVFLLGYLVILELWPGPPARMLWGMWPLFLMLFAAGLRELQRLARPRAPIVRLAAAAVAVWLVGGYAVYESRGIRGRWWETVPRALTPSILGVVAWTRENTRPDDLVATDAEGSVFLYTGRRTVPVRAFTTDDFLAEETPETEAREGLMPLLAAYPVRVVVTGTPGSQAAAVLLTRTPRPLLAPAGRHPWGAGFTVVGR